MRYLNCSHLAQSHEEEGDAPCTKCDCPTLHVDTGDCISACYEGTNFPAEEYRWETQAKGDSDA